MSTSYNYEKALSLDWNGQLFVLTIRNENPITGSNYLYSNDGYNWFSSSDLSNSPIITTKNPYNIKWLGSNYTMIGNLATSSGNTILKSIDGKNYSALPTYINGPLYDIESNLEFQNTVTFPKNTILALGGSSSDTTKIAYSIDEGVTWIPASNSSQIFSNTVNNAVWTGKIWVAVGSGGNTIGTSVNGNTWFGQGSYIFTTAGYGICWSREQALIVAGGSGTNSLACSYDGIFWNGLGNTLLSTVYDIQWNGSIWIAAGIPISGNKSIAYSFDGTNWNLPQQTNLFDITATKIGWNGSFWTVIGQSSAANGSYNLAISQNGVNWNMQNNTSFVSSISNIYTNPNTNLTMYTGNFLSVFAPSKLIGISSTNTSITFSFTPPSKNVLYYTVTSIPTIGSNVVNTFNPPATSYTISGLPYTISNINYSIYLTANYSDGTSATSLPLTYNKLATTLPNAPTGLLYSTNSANTISITWNASSDLSITSYIITAIDPSNNIITQTKTAPATSYTITGLGSVSVYYVTYTISIQAVNIAGSSIPSNSISASTLDSSLILYYKFDTNINNNASGNYNLSYSNTTATNECSISSNKFKLGTAALYKGSRNNNSYILLSSVPPGSTGFTMTFWFNLDNQNVANWGSGTGVIIDMTSNGVFNGTSPTLNDRFYLGSNGSATSGRLFFSSITSSTSWLGSDLPTTVWYHVAFVVYTNNDIDYYLNGSFVQKVNSNGAYANVNRQLGIFVKDGTATGYAGNSSVLGSIDDFRYYNRKLTNSEITNIYNFTY